MKKTNKLLYLLFPLLIASHTQAYAQSCATVEARVNARTATLGAIITGSITVAETTLIAQEWQQRALLLSAFRVNTAQSSAGADQRTLATKQAGEATASTVVAQKQRMAIAEATHKYQSTGYDPCAQQEKSSAFYQATQQHDGRRSSITGQITALKKNASPNDWVTSVKANPVDGTALYNGDTRAAGHFINVVVGIPDVTDKTSEGRVAGDLASLEEAKRDTYRSLAANVLSDVAAESGDEGALQKLRDLGSHWVGDDGGEKWSSAIAAQHERGILQDAIRIEAANVAALAYQVKRSARTEASAAALLLSMIDNRIKVIAKGDRP